MITIPSNLSTLDKRALQDLAQAAIEDLMPSCNGDFCAANRRARIVYPALFDAIGKAVFPQPDSVTPILSNAEAAAIPRWNDGDLDRLGMARDSSLDEVKTAWTAGGNGLDPDRADDIFDSLVNATAKSRGLSYEAAESALRLRHKGLASQADALKTAKKLSAALPAKSLPGSPLFSALAGRPMGPAGQIRPLGNALDNDGVRQTYFDAVQKHMKTTGETDPLKAHKAVLDAHPALAQALKTGKKTDADAQDKAEAVAGVLAKNAAPFPMPLSADNRRVLEWILTEAKNALRPKEVLRLKSLL